MDGFIYQIFIESHPNIHYVGSTMTNLAERWQAHKKGFQTFLENRKKVISIHPYFESLGIDNFQIRLLKKYEVVDRKHLIAYEQLWINKLKPVNIQKHLYKTRHIIRTLDRIDYYKNREKSLQQCKEYYKKNSETIKERVQNYRVKNLEKIKLRKQKKYFCPCSPNVEKRWEDKARHERTEKHLKFIDSQPENKE